MSATADTLDLNETLLSVENVQVQYSAYNPEIDRLAVLKKQLTLSTLHTNIEGFLGEMWGQFPKPYVSSLRDGKLYAGDYEKSIDQMFEDAVNPPGPEYPVPDDPKRAIAEQNGFFELKRLMLLGEDFSDMYVSPPYPGSKMIAIEFATTKGGIRTARRLQLPIRDGQTTESAIDEAFKLAAYFGISGKTVNDLIENRIKIEDIGQNLDLPRLEATRLKDLNDRLFSAGENNEFNVEQFIYEVDQAMTQISGVQYEGGKEKSKFDPRDKRAFEEIRYLLDEMGLIDNYYESLKSGIGYVENFNIIINFSKTLWSLHKTGASPDNIHALAKSGVLTEDLFREFDYTPGYMETSEGRFGSPLSVQMQDYENGLKKKVQNLMMEFLENQKGQSRSGFSENTESIEFQSLSTTNTSSQILGASVSFNDPNFNLDSASTQQKDSSQVTLLDLAMTKVAWSRTRPSTTDLTLSTIQLITPSNSTQVRIIRRIRFQSNTRTTLPESNNQKTKNKFTPAVSIHTSPPKPPQALDLKLELPRTTEVGKQNSNIKNAKARALTQDPEAFSAEVQESTQEIFVQSEAQSSTTKTESIQLKQVRVKSRQINLARGKFESSNRVESTNQSNSQTQLKKLKLRVIKQPLESRVNTKKPATSKIQLQIPTGPAIQVTSNINTSNTSQQVLTRGRNSRMQSQRLSAHIDSRQSPLAEMLTPLQVESLLRGQTIEVYDAVAKLESLKQFGLTINASKRNGFYRISMSN